MRVIGGAFRGRPLQAPPGRSTRPTSDRVREALFSSLSDRIAGARFLDLYAGSGAVGIEALSRGAERVVLVERDRAAAQVARRNLGSLGVEPAHARVAETSAAAFCSRPVAPSAFDTVFADPPYDVDLATLARHVEDLDAAGALADDAVVVVERDRRDTVLATDPLSLGFLVEARRRTYGDTVLVYFLRPEP